MKLVLSLLVIIFCGEAFANSNIFIPNYYRNRRLTNFGPSIGWSDRHEVGMRVKNDKEKYEFGGTEIFQNDEKAINPYVFHRFENGINTELDLTLSKSETDITGTATTRDTDAKGYIAHLGYELKDVPVAFGFGFTNFKSTTDLSGGGSSESKTSLVNLGAGYKLDGNVYLGVNYLNLNTHDGDTSDFISVGIGKVYGDVKNPDSASELNFTTKNEEGDNLYSLGHQGLCNRGPIQYYSTLSLDVTDGTEKDTLAYEASLGMDYQIEHFYFGPEVGISVDNNNNNTKETDTEASLQVGYRDGQLEFYAQYNLSQKKQTEVVATSNSLDKHNVITLAGSYRF